MERDTPEGSDCGYIQVYTGDGKGKTTAALGLSLRAVCAGKRVFFGQFIKGSGYSELKAPDYLPGFEIVQFGRGCFIGRNPGEEDAILARKGLMRCSEILSSGDHDLVVLDEVNVAIWFGLLSVDEVIGTIRRRARHVEVVLTGRHAPPELIDLADLVTEMKEIKHYYQNGIAAREGIER